MSSPDDLKAVAALRERLDEYDQAQNPDVPTLLQDFRNAITVARRLAEGQARPSDAQLQLQANGGRAAQQGPVAWQFVLCDYDNLPKEIDRELCGSEYNSYLLVYKEGKLHKFFSDGMEPEDVRFSRDLRWIKPLLEEVAAPPTATPGRDKP